MSASNTTVFLILLLVGGYFPASAHTGIARTVPEHDAVIDRAPALLRFVFPGEVTVTNARVLPVDENGLQRAETVTVRLPRNRLGQSTAFGLAIDLGIPRLGPGKYQVVFQVRSVDGHELADDFTFTIAE